MAWDKIHISARTLDFPRYCACCMGEATTTHKAQASGKKHSDKKWWAIPWCWRCSFHVWVSKLAPIAALAAFVGLLASGWIATENGWGDALTYSGIAALVAFVLVTVGALLIKKKSCARTGAYAVRFLGSTGTEQSFRMANSAYAKHFLEMNRYQNIR